MVQKPCFSLSNSITYGTCILGHCVWHFTFISISWEGHRYFHHRRAGPRDQRWNPLLVVPQPLSGSTGFEPQSLRHESLFPFSPCSPLPSSPSTYHPGVPRVPRKAWYCKQTELIISKCFGGQKGLEIQSRSWEKGREVLLHPMSQESAQESCQVHSRYVCILMATPLELETWMEGAKLLEP